MADLDVQIANGGSFGYGYGKNSYPGMALTSNNTLVVPFTRSLGSPATYKHCVASSTDFGQTWSETTVNDFGTGEYVTIDAGMHLHMNPAGTKLFMVGGHSNLAGTTLGINLYTRVGSTWSTTTVLDHSRTLWSTSSSIIRSYWRPGDNNTDDIVIFWTEYPDTSGYWKMYMRIWNSVSGLGTEQNVSTQIGYDIYGAGYDGGMYNIVPHPTTYEPILAFIRTINTRSGIDVYVYNGDSTWTGIGSITDTNFGCFNPMMYVRRAADSTYVLDMYYQKNSSTATASRRRHALGGGSWSSEETGKTYTYPYYGIAFACKNAGDPANEENDRYMIYSRGTNIYCQLPPHTTPSTQYELVPIESSARSKRAILTLYYHGPDGHTLFPYYRFGDKYCFAYERDVTGSPYKEIRFFARDGIVWNEWDVPYPIWLSQTAEESVLLGITPVVDGDDLVESPAPELLPAKGSLTNYVYQKLEFRNDLQAKKQLTILFESSAGTPLLAEGTVDDTISDAIGYTYTSPTYQAPTAVEVGDSVYLWVRWQPPAGYQTTPVGAVTHRITRTIK